MDKERRRDESTGRVKEKGKEDKDRGKRMQERLREVECERMKRSSTRD